MPNSAPQPEVQLNGRSYTVRTEETLLDALLRQGAEVVFSCRGGICQACALRCTAGQVPAEARRSLPEHLQARQYLLACQCRPVGNLQLTSPEPRDLRTRCTLTAVSGLGTHYVRLTFEPVRTLSYQPGDHLRVVHDEDPDHDPTLVLTSDPAEGDWQAQAVLHCPEGQALPAWLQGGEDAVFGREIDVWRPPQGAGRRRFRTDSQAEEAVTPDTDPALWHELDDGRQVRTILEDFYAQVFQDERLRSFFAGTTPERATGQQYGFLRQLMTGEKVYFGDRPRNAHHWMVISDELMDYRQALMVATLQRHGLSPAQIARWTRFEEHWRRDMVKAAPFPKVQHGIEYALDGFDREVLSCGALCDHCGGEIPEGTEVLYHRRLGTISCTACGPAAARTPT